VLRDIIEFYDEETFLVLDGFDKAIIGVEEKNMLLIYSVRKCLKILEKQMSEEEAIEYFYYNVVGSYVADKSPILCFDNL
jgi:hypothetical protein